MKGILVDESAKIYSEPSDQTLSLTTLQKGDEFELGKVSRKKNDVWVEVILPSGVKGFIPGATHIFEVKKVQFLSKSNDMHKEPNADSEIIKNYPQNVAVTAIGVEKDDDKGWVKVIDEQGTVGYVKGDIRIRLVQEVTTTSGKKQILSGAMFIILATVFYFVSVSNSSANGSMSFLMVAVFTFGLFQLVQGILQYRKAKNQEKPKN
jgi:uncharacterized protein YgiM (DUF1202 family)